MHQTHLISGCSIMNWIILTPLTLESATPITHLVITQSITKLPPHINNKKTSPFNSDNNPHDQPVQALPTKNWTLLNPSLQRSNKKGSHRVRCLRSRLSEAINKTRVNMSLQPSKDISLCKAIEVTNWHTRLTLTLLRHLRHPRSFKRLRRERFRARLSMTTILISKRSKWSSNLTARNSLLKLQ